MTSQIGVHRQALHGVTACGLDEELVQSTPFPECVTCKRCLVRMSGK